DLKLQGAEVAGVKTPWGYTAEFKLPWKNFPDFAPKAGEVIGIECELCSSDGGPRVDRTFVYASPAAVGSPAAFGRVRLVDKIEPGSLKALGRALLPLSLTRSTNYAWLYDTVCVPATIEGSVAQLEGKLRDASGKVRKTSTGTRKALDGGFTLWTGSWEMFDLPPGVYTLELVATDKAGGVISRGPSRCYMATRQERSEPTASILTAHCKIPNDLPNSRSDTAPSPQRRCSRGISCFPGGRP